MGVKAGSIASLIFYIERGGWGQQLNHSQLPNSLRKSLLNIKYREMIFLSGWKEKRNEFLIRKTWYPWGYIPYMDSSEFWWELEYIKGHVSCNEVFMVLTSYSLRCFFPPLNFILYQFLLSVLQICWQTNQPPRNQYSCISTFDHMHCGNFLVFSYPAEYIITECDCISYCI